MTPETILEHDGVEQTVTEWALDYGITPDIITARIARGQAISEAITTPMMVTHSGQQLPLFHNEQKPAAQKKARGRTGKLYTFDGVTAAVPEWSRRSGIKAATLYDRLNNGWSIEAAITVPLRSIHDRRTPGAISNLPASTGTGAGSTAQETQNISFSESNACPK